MAPRQHRTPRVTYLAWLGPVVLWMLGQAAPSLSWWSAVPVGGITVACVAFGLGLVAQDIYNRSSWIWYWVRRLTALFKVNILAARVIHGEPDVLSVILSFKTVRKILSGNLTITVYPEHDPDRPFVIFNENGIVSAKFTDRQIRICSFRIAKPGQKPFYDVWGEDKGPIDYHSTLQTVVSNSRNLVVVSMRDGCFCQTFRAMIHVLDRQQEFPNYVYIEHQDNMLL